MWKILILFTIFELICSCVKGVEIAENIFNTGTNVTYSSVKTVCVRSHMDCCRICSEDDNCVAAVMNKDDKKFCQLLSLEDNQGNYQWVDNNDAQIVWMKNGNGEPREVTTQMNEEETTTTTTITTTSLPPIPCDPQGFTVTNEGCFYVGTDPFEWDAAQMECADMGANVQLAKTDTLEVSLNVSKD